MLSPEFCFSCRGWMTLSCHVLPLWHGGMSISLEFENCGRGWMKLSFQLLVFRLGWINLPIELELDLTFGSRLGCFGVTG